MEIDGRAVFCYTRPQRGCVVRGSEAAAYRARPAPMDEVRHAKFEQGMTQDGVDDKCSPRTPSASQQQSCPTEAEGC